MIKIICDVCKKEIEEDSKNGAVFSLYRVEHTVDFKSGELGIPTPKNIKYDCCGNCAEKIYEFINQTIGKQHGKN